MPSYLFPRIREFINDRKHKMLFYLLFQIYVNLVKSDLSPLSTAEAVRGSILFVMHIDGTNHMLKS